MSDVPESFDYGYDPSDPLVPDRQASPYYTYIQVLKQRSDSEQCTGGTMSSCWSFLKTNGGTPSVAAVGNCTCARPEGHLRGHMGGVRER